MIFYIKLVLYIRQHIFFINKLRNIHNLEREIAKSNNKFSDYTKKWNKFLEANN